MKRFLSTVVFCIFLLVAGLFVFLPSTNAEKNLLENLLNLPAPPPPNPLVVNIRNNRSADFFNKNKPPSDDAPLEDLLAYWQGANQFNRKLTYAPTPSDKTFERLRGKIEETPELLPSLINSLPDTDETANFVRQMYDRELSEKKLEEEWRDAVKQWLTYHSDYFSDELLKLAEKAGDTSEYVTNQEELLALARVDWDKARPILDRLYNDNQQPVSQTLARWAFYAHAVKEKDSSDIEKYRRELQATVENKSDKPGNRDLAMDALIETGDFEGRDDWYYSLLEDETLHNLQVNGSTYTGLTTILNHSPSDKYTAKMLELVNSDKPAVRNAAVRNLSTLLDEKNPEVVRALLPWLENPAWAKETGGERRQLIVALSDFEMPESVPGLIAVLNEKQTQQSSMSSMGSSNTMNSNMMSVSPGNFSPTVSRNMTETESYQYRSEAVSALAMQKDFRAVAPLRLILPQVEGWQRGNVVRAILLSRGFSIPEQVEALELVAKDAQNNLNSNMMTTNKTVVGDNNDPSEADIEDPQPTPRIGNTMMANGNYSIVNRPFNPSTDIKPLLGMQLVNQTDAEEELVTALIDRIGVLDTQDPPLAFSLRKIMQAWNGAAVNRLLLRDLKNDKADTDSVVKLLSLRKQLRENQSNDVFDVRSGTPIANGIAACLLEDAGGYDAILAGENIETKTAMLGCARLVRAQLPIQKVAENLKSPNKMLALAAERYLESEDSPEARQIVLSLHPNEAKILGARAYFAGDNSSAVFSEYLPALFASVNDSMPQLGYYIYNGFSDDLAATEKKLQKEVKENQELLGVYAYDDNFIRIYKDKAVFSWQTDKARYRERNLTEEEFSGIKNYLAAEQAAGLPPFLSDCEGECKAKELLMFGRQGGRRVFSLSDSQPKFFAGLAQIFEGMRQPPAKLHYWLEKNVAGLEILFEDENLQAEAVWKIGDDFRVLVNNESRRKQIDEEIEKQNQAEAEKLEETETGDGYEKYQKLEETQRKRREQREYENYNWYKFAGTNLAGITEQPNGIEFLPKQDGAAIRADSLQWKARTPGFEIRADGEGLYKIAGGRTTKIREGYFEKPVVTSNGRWAVVTRYDEAEGPRLVRVNLTTNKEFKVDFEEYALAEAVAFLPAINKVLIFNGDGGEYETKAELTERAGKYLFLDAETGAVQPAKGEIRPLAQQTYRPLQPTGTADEFWAAIPDATKDETQIGTYNAKTLAFKSSIKIPQITFNSMQMWIDAGKIYFVYEGHLLSLPLK